MASPSPNDLTRQQLDELDVLLQRMLALPVSSPEPAVAFPPPPPLPDLPPATPRPDPRAMPDSPAVSWRADTPTGSKAPHLTPAPEPATAFTPSVLPFPPSARANPEPMPMPPPRPAPAQNAPVPRLFAPSFTPSEPHPPVVSPGTLRGVDAPALPFDFRRADPLPPPTPPLPGVVFPDVNPFADPITPATEAMPAATARPVPVYLWPVFALNWVLEFLLGWFGPVGQVLMRPLTKTLLGWLGVLLLLGAGAWAARGLGWVSWPR